HGHEIAVKHGRGTDVEFAQGNGWKFQGQAARLPDAALDRLGQLAEVDMTVIELAPGLSDADDRLGQVHIVKAGSLEPRAPREAPLASIQGAARAAGERIGLVRGEW